MPAPADDDAPTADLPVVESTPADVFRLQLVTLSNEAKAIELQSTLSAALEVPIYIVPRGQHYLLQAGQYETHSAATQLKERATTLSSDYADAFVVSTTAAAPLPADPSAPSSAATAPAPHDGRHAVRVSGEEARFQIGVVLQDGRERFDRLG